MRFGGAESSTCIKDASIAIGFAIREDAFQNCRVQKLGGGDGHGKSLAQKKKSSDSESRSKNICCQSKNQDKQGFHFSHVREDDRFPLVAASRFSTLELAHQN